MLCTGDLEKLIAVKRREIEREKTFLGLALSPEAHSNVENGNETEEQHRSNKQVNFSDNKVLCNRDDASTEDKKERDSKRTLYELEEKIPSGLERYIRRYVGLPVMLKAGEYSPNNPLIRGERSTGDVLLGLGEYERRRNTLRKIRQQQYREYLDQQAKKKQDAKDQADKERREHEEREKEREERERERLQVERERCSPKQRASLKHVPGASALNINKVDTGVQVNGVTKPLSVAVQTDDAELFRSIPSRTKCMLTQAERELSPRTVVESRDDRQVQPAQWAVAYDKTDKPCERRRRSYGDFDERTSTLKRSNRDKLVSDLRHTYMPSIFDADAIQLRNMLAEKDAAAKRQFHQQELKNQILEQQRIREERKNREKMLEQAEMRRLEEQLSMLRCAQDKEVGKHHDITATMRQNATDYDSERTALQREIDIEQQRLLRATSHPARVMKRNTNTSKSDPQPSKLPLYYPRVHEKKPNFEGTKKNDHEKKPYSTNIPDNSIFSEHYDVDSYLRRNLNFNPSNKREIDKRTSNVQYHFDIESIGDNPDSRSSRLVVEKALVHYPSDEQGNQPSVTKEDTLPVTDANKNNDLSDAMKIVDDKWKVPAVQKNILKSAADGEGKNVSILTQLGSIRRQLQLEQLKLDRMISKNDV